MEKTKATLWQKMRSKSGMNLVSVMISGAIGIIILAAITQGTINSSKGQKAVQGNIEFDNLKTAINLVLQNNDTCRQGFKHLPVAGPPAVPAKFGPVAIVNTELFNQLVLSQGGASSLVVQQGQDLGGGLRVTTLRLAYQPPFADGVVVGTTKQHYVQLEVEVTKTANTSFGAQRLNNFQNPPRFMIATDNTGTNEIIECGGTDDNSDRYVMSCVDSGPVFGLYCCRLERANGNVTCRRSPGGVWFNLPSPYGPTTLGAYGITLDYYGPPSTALMLCRLNSTTGSGDCFRNDLSVNTWLPAGTPF